MPQVRIELDEELYAVLERYAEEEDRLPAGQARWLVRQALRDRVKYDTALRHLESATPEPAAKETEV